MVIEAWAHEIPVVAAASDGPKGLIQDQENGLLVPLNNVEALARAIKKVLGSSPLRKKLVEQGLSTYLKDYTEEKVCQHYLSFFEQITPKKRCS